MTPVFADTTFYIAMVNPRDTLHAAATRSVRGFSGEAVTSEYVLVEVGNYLSRAAEKRGFVTLMATLRADPTTTIVPAGGALFDLGLDRYGRRLDKNWSLTDCISFVVMRQHGLTEALTGDRHFEQAGFKVLLK